MLIPMRAYPQIESVEGAFVSSTPRRAAQLKNRGDHARATAGVAAPSRKGERRIHEKREGNGRVVDQDGLTCMRLCTGLWRVSGTTTGQQTMTRLLRVQAVSCGVTHTPTMTRGTLSLPVRQALSSAW